MTVSTTKASDVFPGNGVATGFDCEWRIFDETDVLVSLVDQTTGADTPLVLNTDYTISGAGDQSGFTVGTVSPVAAGTSLYVRRAIPYTQPTDFTNQGAFFPTMHEDAMDRLAMQIQQQVVDLSRSLKMPGGVSGLNAQLPSLKPLAPLVVNAAGDGFEMGDFSGTGDLLLRSNLASSDPGKGASLVHDAAKASDLASAESGKGASLVGYSDPLAPAFLKTTSDIVNGLPVSILRVIPAADHAAIFARTATADYASGINDLLSEMFSAGRGHLIHEGGTITIGSPIIVPGGIRFSGCGGKSKLSPMAAMTCMLQLNGDYAEVDGLTLQNVSSFATRGVEVKDTIFHPTINRNYLFDFTYAIYNVGGQGVHVTDNFALNNDFCLYSENDFRNSLVNRNFFWSGTGIRLTKSTQQAEGVRITNNTILPSVRASSLSGSGISITHGMEIFIGHNIVDNVDKVGLALAAGTTDGPITLIKSVGNWYGNDGGGVSAEGSLLYGNVSDILFDGDTFASSILYGLHIGISGQPTPDRITVQNCKFLSCGGGDIRVELGTNLRVRGNRFSHVSNAYREESNAVSAFVSQNQFASAGPAPRSSASRYWRNSGFITENKGSGGVTSAATNSGLINHGLSVTPTASDFVITPTNIPTSDVGTFAVTNISATQFRVDVRTAPGTGGFNFNWSVNADRG